MCCKSCWFSAFSSAPGAFSHPAKIVEASSEVACQADHHNGQEGRKLSEKQRIASAVEVLGEGEGGCCQWLLRPFQFSILVGIIQVSPLIRPHLVRKAATTPRVESVPMDREKKKESYNKKKG